MANAEKSSEDRGQTQAEVAVARKSLFADLKKTAQKGRDDRSAPTPR